MPTQPSKQLETFGNPNPARDYTIEIIMPEFTCLCPKTGQPDFATLILEYIPDKQCVELKSLKQYIWSFRSEGAFHEAVTNQILGDLVAATQPRWMRLRAEFNVRGGIYTTVTAEHRQPGFAAPPPPPRTAPEHAEHVEIAGHEPPAAPPAGARPGAARADSAPTGSRFRMLARSHRTDGTPEPETPPAAPPPPGPAKTKSAP
jgi:7-cyano-7-deazaguanine reductase